MERVAFWGRKSNSEMSKGGGLADGHLMRQPNAAAVMKIILIPVIWLMQPFL